ncbi:ATP-binding cassette domain-containing protein [uncultured Ferrimonas sp.]|uniref:ATP-binding cassette domain-containing protein n=1 Tax=uncultured Ferrimonas sp. TaxID=432640 RepID=UPI00262002C6|nr:ATP-binding cassette domain-containing protein [uncultured Ferrimonas sp.]
MSVLAIEQLQYHWPQQPNSSAVPQQLNVPSLTVAAGEMVMLQGQSGSGKTTLMNLIAGVLQPQQGQILLQGQAINTLPARKRDALRAEQLGIIFQQFNLLPFLSVLDNVLLPLQFAPAPKPKRRTKAGNPSPDPQQRAQQLLQALELEPPLWQQAVNALSVGQQQRVAAARALLQQPALILADEPTSALDPANRDRFMGLLTEQCQQAGSALLLISHDPALQSAMHRSYRLRQQHGISEVQPCGH